MKRYSIILVVVTLALLAAGCTPRAVLEDGSVATVKQWVFDDVTISVRKGDVKVTMANAQLDVEDASSMFGLGSLTPWTDMVTDWMGWAGVNTVAVNYLGDGIGIEVNGQPFPSLSLPKGSIATAGRMGVDIASNAGVRFTPELGQIIRETLIPVGGTVAESVRLKLVFEFPR